MDRLRSGEKIAGVSAVLLFVFMFLDWFDAELTGPGGSVTVTGDAWEAFSLIDWVLLVTVVSVLVAVFIRVSDAVLELPVSPNAVVAILGAVSTLVILIRIIDPPAIEAIPGVDMDMTAQVGAFLGLIAAAGITAGAFRATREEDAAASD